MVMPPRVSLRCVAPPAATAKEFSAQGADPAFGERVGYRGMDRGLENLETFGSEDLVEVAGELAGAVSQKCSGVAELAGMGHEEVASGLGGPGRPSGWR